MGVLAPFYLAGLAALSLPFILHLVRRTPKGRREFSSLMFLTPSPPRLTRRSRLDQILLLLLRLAALGLLAFAFSRPFIRESALLSLDSLPSRKVAILVDTSASMRRDGIWKQVRDQVDQVLAQLTPQDEVALYRFGERLERLVPFEVEPSERGAKIENIRQRVRSLAPTWEATNLGDALTAIATEIDVALDAEQSAAEPQVVVISDFQRSSRIESLQSYDWPKRVRVIPRSIAATGRTNAFAHLLRSDEPTGDNDARVRVVNSADSTHDQFTIGWANSTGGAGKESEIAIYVPPGQSRVVRLPRHADSLTSDQIMLRGDDQPFDNVHYVVPPKKLIVNVLYVGDDAAEDPQGLQYYLRLAVSDDPIRQVEISPTRPEDLGNQIASRSPHLMVVTQELSDGHLSAIRSFVEKGGWVVNVARDSKAASVLAGLLPGIEVRPTPKPVEGKYLLLGELDFTHSLFLPFANPRYSDFTKIHFWRHQPINVSGEGSVQVVARFDNGDPAIVEGKLQKGRVLGLLFGWNPDESQLALSSKFVPLIGNLIEQVSGGGQLLGGVNVLERVQLLDSGESAQIVISKPNGTTMSLSSGETHFDGTDEPGLYRVRIDAEERTFAVNLNANESNTAPLDLAQIEQLGVKVGSTQSTTDRLERMRQQRDSELEGRQKVWRWLIVCAIGILLVETVWAGVAAGQINKPMEVAR